MLKLRRTQIDLHLPIFVLYNSIYTLTLFKTNYKIHIFTARRKYYIYIFIYDLQIVCAVAAAGLTI